MKTSVILLLTLFMINPCFCQEWGTIGTQWYYTERFAFSGDVDYLMFTSEKDTLFNGIPCKKLVKRHSLFCNDRPHDFEVMFSRNDTIFFYDPNFNQFQVLYDFNAQVGDSWIIKTKNNWNPPDTDTILIMVDSTGTITINGTVLKKWYVTYHCYFETAYNYSYTSVIVERIGDMNYLFNYFPQSAMTCDANWADGLRCYEDTYIGFYSTGIADSCTYIFVGLNEIEQRKEAIKVYPNPAKDKITIESQAPLHENYITVFSANGMVMLEQSLTECETTINISKFPSGIYFVRFSNEKIVEVIRFIKD